MAEVAKDPLKKHADAGLVTTGVPAALALGADPVANMGLTIAASQKIADANRASQGAGTPWGPMKYGAPDPLVLPKDASQMPGFSGSPEARALAASLAAQRARNTTADPYAASRENEQEMVRANMGHEDYLSKQQMLRIRQNQAIQDYLDDLEKYEREENLRNAVLDKAGRTAYGGGQAILSYFTKGAFSGNKPEKQKPTTTKQQLNQYGGIGDRAYGPSY